VLLSVVLITHNEEANLPRTLKSVQPLVADGRGEIIVVDSHSTDQTVEIAKAYGAKVFIEDWKGFSAQKNSAIDKAEADWILSLDADEEVSPDLAAHIVRAFGNTNNGPFEWNVAPRINVPMHDLRTDVGPLPLAFWISRKNHFLGRWIRYGGYYPDRKIRLFARGGTRFDETRIVHEDVKTNRKSAIIPVGALLHHSYPTISDYIEHMNRYSSLGAEMVLAKGPLRFPVLDIFFRPILTFVYNYIFRLGFLDGYEGVLLHINHAIYVSWKYAKAWEQMQSPTHV
jgi:glycosyltransferase involved in cell wall biosynthesis